METSAVVERAVLTFPFARRKLCAEGGEAKPTGDAKQPMRLFRMEEP
jgi:hypothetical protein